jgi:two-component system, OmpR family, sensor histidine kinase KdpD
MVQRRSRTPQQQVEPPTRQHEDVTPDESSGSTKAHEAQPAAPMRARAAGARGRRGSLRVYLGAAPGVGKTYAMLGEGRRRRGRGADVVVGFVETYGRVHTIEQIGDLPIVPRRRLPYRDTSFEEMDLDAVLARRPQVALVDELAHTNVPGSRNQKRWQDIRELLDAGIDVISTVNIQHLESLSDVVERITGIRQRETVPDELVRAAEQVELVDQTPEALRRRLAHGNISAPETIDAALANYFRVGNLAALRELALLWVADQVDAGLEDYRRRHGITEPWETRERVVVALTGAPGTESLIRRGARIAQRAHGELIGLHVSSEDGLVGPRSALMEDQRKLLADLGGEYHEVAGSDIAAALVEFARAENATQLVLGASQRSRWSELIRGSVINRAVRMSGPIDVHVISHERPTDPGDEALSPTGRRRSSRVPAPALSARRRAAGWLLALAGVPLLTLLFAQLREHMGLPTVLLLFLALVVLTATVGGRLPAVVAAAGAFLCANWFFTPPYHRWTIAEGENVVALLVFLGVALAVSRFVDAATRRAAEAARARSEARTLASLAATMGEDDPLPTLLGHLRSAFGLTAAALLRHTPESPDRPGTADSPGTADRPETTGTAGSPGTADSPDSPAPADGAWQVEAAAGEPVPTRPDQADLVEELSPGIVLAMTGHRLAAEDQAVLNAFAGQLAAVLERHRLRVEAGRVEALAEANALRTALLQAVSHDLRTPLASIKASVTSLSQDEVAWSDEETAEFLSTINDETDRLTTLVANLLDMSRIQAGVLHPTLRAVGLEEVLPAALAGLGHRLDRVEAEVPETLPPVLADAPLLERVLANVIDNAVRFTPPGQKVHVTAGEFGGRLHLRVVDRGPGIPPAQRDAVFQPFQRLGDNPAASGVGLGLAVAKGFCDAMGASIEIDDTPGGGATTVISIPVADDVANDVAG